MDGSQFGKLIKETCMRHKANEYIGRDAALAYLKANTEKTLFGRIQPSGRIQEYRFNKELDRVEIRSGGNVYGVGGWSFGKSFDTADRFWEQKPERRAYHRLAASKVRRPRKAREARISEDNHTGAHLSLRQSLSELQALLNGTLERLDEVLSVL